MINEKLVPKYSLIYYILSQKGENMYMAYRRGGIEAFCQKLSEFKPRYFQTAESFDYCLLDAKKLRETIIAYKRYTPYSFTEEDKVYMMAYEL